MVFILNKLFFLTLILSIWTANNVAFSQDCTPEPYCDGYTVKCTTCINEVLPKCENPEHTVACVLEGGSQEMRPHCVTYDGGIAIIQAPVICKE